LNCAKKTKTAKGQSKAYPPFFTVLYHKSHANSIYSQKIAPSRPKGQKGAIVKGGFFTYKNTKSPPEIKEFDSLTKHRLAPI